MTCFVQYVPYKLRRGGYGSWDDNRELLGDRVVKKIAEYAPNVPGRSITRQILTPLDLERIYGLTEGNIFHGDLNLEQLFFNRPVPGWSHTARRSRGCTCAALELIPEAESRSTRPQLRSSSFARLEKRKIQGGGCVRLCEPQ